MSAISRTRGIRLKMQGLFFSVSFALIGSFLYGCTTTPPQPIRYYSAPPGISTAVLKNELHEPGKDKGFAALNLLDPECGGHNSGRVFTNENLTRTPDMSVNVPAGTRIVFQYWQNSNREYCIVEGMAVLEQGKVYKVVAGPGLEAGPIPYFTDKGVCRLAVIDETTKISVPLEKFLCPKQSSKQ